MTANIKNYMEEILRFMGFEEFHTILVEPTSSSNREEIFQAAKKEASQIAKTF